MEGPAARLVARAAGPALPGPANQRRHQRGPLRGRVDAGGRLRAGPDWPMPQPTPATSAALQAALAHAAGQPLPPPPQVELPLPPPAPAAVAEAVQRFAAFAAQERQRMLDELREAAQVQGGPWRLPPGFVIQPLPGREPAFWHHPMRPAVDVLILEVATYLPDAAGHTKSARAQPLRLVHALAAVHAAIERWQDLLVRWTVASRRNCECYRVADEICFLCGCLDRQRELDPLLGRPPYGATVVAEPPPPHPMGPLTRDPRRRSADAIAVR